MRRRRSVVVVVDETDDVELQCKKRICPSHEETIKVGNGEGCFPPETVVGSGSVTTHRVP